MLGATTIGLLVGRRLRHLSDSLKEPFAVLQGALLGVVGLLLAFGLALAVDRYESRRAALVADANTIGTTYLRAQTLTEPARSHSLGLLARYTDASIRLTKAIPGSGAAAAADRDAEQLQRQLWAIAGRQLDDHPVASAQRLYIETLNEDDRRRDRPRRRTQQPACPRRCCSSRSRGPRSRSACWPRTSRCSGAPSSPSSSPRCSSRCCCSSPATSTGRRAA